MALGDSFHVWSWLGKQSYQEYGFQGSDMRRLDQMKPRGLKRTSHFFPLALSTHPTLGLREWTQHLDGAWTLYRGLLHTLKSQWRGQDTEYPCGTGCLDILPHRKKWQDRSLLGQRSTHQHWKKKIYCLIMSFEIIVCQKEFDWKGLLLCILVTLLITSYSPKQWKQQKVSLKRKRRIQHHWSFGCSFMSPSQFQISLLVCFNTTGSKTQLEFWKVRKNSVHMLARIILRKLIWKISDCSRVEWFRKSCGKRQ